VQDVGQTWWNCNVCFILCDFSAKQLIRGEPNVSYICSRYYRAPELIFGATDYTSQIGNWFCPFCEIFAHPYLFMFMFLVLFLIFLAPCMSGALKGNSTLKNVSPKINIYDKWSYVSVIKLTMQIRYRRILTIKLLISRNVFLHGGGSSRPSSLF